MQWCLLHVHWKIIVNNDVVSTNVNYNIIHFIEKLNICFIFYGTRFLYQLIFNGKL